MEYAAPRQQRSEETFERIVTAAERLFSIRKTTSVPVRELCEEAEASRSSFYARFADGRGPARVAYERFRVRVLQLAETIDIRWSRERPGADDFDAFVRFVVETYADFWERERRLVQAFRSGETDDPELRAKREALDRAILESVVRVTCQHYPFDATALNANLARGIAVIVAAFRGALDYPDQLEIASPEARARLTLQLSELVLRFTPRPER